MYFDKWILDLKVTFKRPKALRLEYMIYEPINSRSAEFQINAVFKLIYTNELWSFNRHIYILIYTRIFGRNSNKITEHLSSYDSTLKELLNITPRCVHLDSDSTLLSWPEFLRMHGCSKPATFKFALTKQYRYR